MLRTVAGVFDFETGLRLVKFRGEAMQEAAEVVWEGSFWEGMVRGICVCVG